MLISFDSRTYFKSRIISFRNSLRLGDLYKYQFKFFGGIPGPQEFLTNLVNIIQKNNYADTTYNFIKSDFHLLNAGFYSSIWKNFKLKSSKRVVLRIDGIGIDQNNFKDKKQIEKDMINLLDKSDNIIYQSKFSRDCFFNIFGINKNNKIIFNGAIDLPEFNFRYINSFNILNKIPDEKYFTVAGRFIDRKRIKEVIKEFYKYNLGYLVVLSDVPKNKRLINKRIIYLGMIPPIFARYVISRSQALIHIDKYDWCPNVVIGALFDGVPVICSNYGGTPEIVSNKGIIIKEFPSDLPPNLEGIEFANQVKFPKKIFRENILDFKNNTFRKKSNFNFSIKNSALKYIEFMNNINFK